MSSAAEQLLLELQNQYLDQLPQQIDEIEQLSMVLEKKGDLAEYQHLLRKVHSLKGSGGTYGFHVLSTICHQFEDFLTLLEAELEQVSSESIDIMMKYIDLLRETQVQLAQNCLEQQHIELQLQQIKRLSHQESRSILVIDSTLSAVALYRDALGSLNVAISSEADAINALNRLMIEQFDLIITAREFNHMTADALIAAIRLSNNANQNIPVILVSSSDRLSSENIAQPNTTLKKSPQLPTQLAETVRETLR